MAKGKLYQPSNGTEGELFIEQWCGTCARDKPSSEGKPFDECDDDELCSILNDTLFYSVIDSEYPSEWIYDENDKPCCTAWIRHDDPIASLPYRCTKTKDMFE